MEVARNDEEPFERGDEARFAGEVWLRPGPVAPDGTSIVFVHFSPRARTHWHAHPGGQFLVAVSGRGRVRSRGDAGVELGPGDVVRIPPGEWHFHGGGQESPLVHIAVNGDGAPEWGDRVTDADYEEGF